MMLGNDCALGENEQNTGKGPGQGGNLAETPAGPRGEGGIWAET